MIVGMDIGSCKTAVAVAEPAEKGGLRLVGACAVPTRGMQNGAITSISELGETVDNVIQQAEAVSRQEIDGVHLSFFGSAFDAQEKYAELEITNRQQKVTGEEKAEVIKRASALDTLDAKLVHRIVQEFILDDAGDIRDPVGMFGQKLGVRIYLVTIRTNIFKSLEACFNKVQVNKISLEYAPLVAAEAVLSQEEINSGVVYLDLGQSASSLVTYQGALRHIRVLKLGGARLTAALARTIKIHLSEAERIKTAYGTCDRETPAQKLLVYNIQGEKKEELDRRTLAEILTAEMEARLVSAIAELKLGKRYSTTAGLVLGGGTARLAGLAGFLESRLELPVRVGRVASFQGGGEFLEDPSYHAALGVIKANRHSHRVGDSEEPGSGPKPAMNSMLARLQRNYTRVRRVCRRIQNEF